MIVSKRFKKTAEVFKWKVIMLYHWHYQINQCWLQFIQDQKISSDWFKVNEEKSSINQEESQLSWTTWKNYHLWLALYRFKNRDADIW